MSAINSSRDDLKIEAFSVRGRANTDCYLKEWSIQYLSAPREMNSDTDTTLVGHSGFMLLQRSLNNQTPGNPQEIEFNVEVGLSAR